MKKILAPLLILIIVGACKREKIPYSNVNEESLSYRYYYSNNFILGCAFGTATLSLRTDGYAEMLVDVEKYFEPEHQFFGFWKLVTDRRTVELNFLRSGYRDFGGGGYGLFEESYNTETVRSIRFRVQEKDLIELPSEEKHNEDHAHELARFKPISKLHLSSEKKIMLWVDRNKYNHPFWEGEEFFSLTFGDVFFEENVQLPKVLWKGKIQGFDYKPGKSYNLTVKRRAFKKPYGQGERFIYELVSIDSIVAH